jgi:lysyl-tRNA synthetase class I
MKITKSQLREIIKEEIVSELTAKDVKKLKNIATGNDFSKATDEFKKMTDAFYKQKFSNLVGKDVLIVKAKDISTIKGNLTGSSFRAKIQDIHTTMTEDGMGYGVLNCKPLDKESDTYLKAMSSKYKGGYEVYLGWNIHIFELDKS